ncbi:hypothetical protein [Pseudomonas lini]
MTMLREYCVRRRLEGFARQGSEASRADLDIGMNECPAQQMLRGGTAANIADADNQNPFKQDNIPRLVNIGGDIALAEHKSFKLRMNPDIYNPATAAEIFKQSVRIYYHEV